jgi:hypothetical protein
MEDPFERPGKWKIEGGFGTLELRAVHGRRRWKA